MADTSHIKEWFILSDETKLRIYTDVGTKAGLNPMAVEKDWWVVHTLSLIFAMDCVPSLVFKGGTSLSKGWGLIERFSEDIDLALDREYLGFKGELSNTQIKKLREKSYHYLTTTFTDELRLKFIETGFPDFEIKYRKVENHDQDPIIIEIYYPKLTEEDTYLKPGILVEVGCRSLIEPHTDKSFKTIVAEYYPDRPFTDSPITVPTVNPERTFLEKIFLLHEEFHKPAEKIRVQRLSRHLYDIERLSRTEYAEKALNDKELYETIVAHRSKFSPIKGVDFTKQNPSDIKFVPPDNLLSAWEADYKDMQENMIHGESSPFAELIEKLKTLQEKINGTKWDA